MILCPDTELSRLVLYRIGLMRELQSIKVTNKKKQPKRYARRQRARRALRRLEHAIAERCHEIFTP